MKYLIQMVLWMIFFAWMYSLILLILEKNQDMRLLYITKTIIYYYMMQMVITTELNKK